jgi:hypothetical protein
MKQFNNTKYPDIKIIEEITKIKSNLWYVSGSKNGYSTSAMAGTKKDALSMLDLHLSYVTENYN